MKIKSISKGHFSPRPVLKAGAGCGCGKDLDVLFSPTLPCSRIAHKRHHVPKHAHFATSDHTWLTFDGDSRPQFCTHIYGVKQGVPFTAKVAEPVSQIVIAPVIQHVKYSESTHIKVNAETIKEKIDDKKLNCFTNWVVEKQIAKQLYEEFELQMASATKPSQKVLVLRAAQEVGLVKPSIPCLLFGSVFGNVPTSTYSDWLNPRKKVDIELLKDRFARLFPDYVKQK